MPRFSLFLLAFLPWLGVSCAGSDTRGPKPSRVYEAQWAEGPIVVDGLLSDRSWVHAAWTEDFVDILGDSLPAPRLRTRAKVLWNREFLFVGAEMEEPHLWATLKDRDAIIYQDDDFEVFLDPDGDGLAYFEIEINVFGTVMDLFLERPYNRGGSAELEWDLVDLQSAVALTGTVNDPSDRDSGWTVELAIPWAGLTPPPGLQGAPLHSPEPGETWRVNFSRVDWPMEVKAERYSKTAVPSRENRHPESNWVWAPQGDVNMHLPEMWGVVRFVAGPQTPPVDASPEDDHVGMFSFNPLWKSETLGSYAMLLNAVLHHQDLGADR